MKYIKYTYVDAKTEICIDKEPAKNGPKHPNIKGLQFIFAAERKYPTAVPDFFGICDDDADLNVDGCLGEVSEADFIVERQTEIESRKPFSSWVVNQAIWDDHLALLSDLWSSLVPMPEGDGMYSWDEDAGSWVAVEMETKNGN